METILILFGYLALGRDITQIGGGHDCQYTTNVRKEKEKFLKCLKENIKKTIDEKNVEKILSYKEFIELLDSGKISPDEADMLIDYAYKNDNPILFRKPQISIPYNDYSINLFFIHKDNESTVGGHLFGNNDDKLKQYVSDPILDWRNKQPEAEINFWYDGNLLSENQIENTSKKFEKINFRNIRSIPFVNDNKDMFETNIEIYYRVDLVKAVILDHIIEKDNKKYAVVTDGDIIAITRDHLFDTLTIQKLNDFGYIFGSSPEAEEENSFMILYNNPIKLKTRDAPNSTENIVEKHRRWILNKAKESFDLGVKDEQQIFYLYSFDTGFKRILYRLIYPKITGKRYDSEYPRGKAMVIPKSHLGSVGYDEDIFNVLKQVLTQKL